MDKYLKEFIAKKKVFHIFPAFHGFDALSSCPVGNETLLGDCFVGFSFFKLISNHNVKVTDITPLLKLATLHFCSDICKERGE